MVYAKTDAEWLTVYYSAKEHYVVGAVFVAMAIFCGLVAYATLQERLSGQVVLVMVVIFPVTGIVGWIAVSSLVGAVKRVRLPRWVIRFSPEEVQVNLLHPGYLSTASAIPEQTLPIPMSDIEWIRQARKPKLWDDDRERNYVDMRLGETQFKSVLAHRAAFQNAIENTRMSGHETVLHMFEGNVIRVAIDGTRWLNAITTYWSANAYPIAPKLTIEDPTDAKAALAQPRELL